MGYRWEVQGYFWSEAAVDYEYMTMYSGQSLVRAVLAAIKAKREGAGCVKVNWR